MSNNDQELKSMQDILTEREVIDLFGIKKVMLDRLRREQKLPFCKISNTTRIYLVRDILNFVESKRIIMNLTE